MVNSVIGYLGPECSHSHQAAIALLNFCKPALPVVLHPYASMEALLSTLGESDTLLGLLPIENALEGSVVAVLETLGLQKHPVYPLAEFSIPIVHCLIQKELGPIDTVISHPQALGQCRETLIRLLGPDLKFQVAASTSEAVRFLQEQTHMNSAAIGTKAAAERYDLQIVQTDISDAPDNVTRFLLLAHHSQVLFNLGSYPQKTSFCLTLPNYPGSLVDLLLIFKKFKVDLSKIESRPAKKRLGEYVFYIDAEGDLTQPHFQPLLAAIRSQTTYCQVLGPYACLGHLPLVNHLGAH